MKSESKHVVALSQVLITMNTRWFVDAPEDTAKERVVLRHLAAGIETKRADAEKRVEINDLLNGREIRANLIQPDLVISN
jgi:pantothenate kinase